ncbi:uncharacterized protein LOC144213783 [Stigmatopora nigra]
MEPRWLLWATTAAIWCQLVAPARAFSHGAGPGACRTLSPGHIRVRPQEPRRSPVTVRASARSYRPGQLVTVTVRSSRDFMGFLLQARHGEETGAGDEGPVPAGGSWPRAPPGTHALRCLSEGDTLTHSDKQPKRNLSFAWRAPRAPAGDVRFYITVVRSYFVYWSGIRSAVVRDGSPAPWTGEDGTRAALAGDPFPAISVFPAASRHRELGGSGVPTPAGKTLNSSVGRASEESDGPEWPVAPLQTTAPPRPRPPSESPGAPENAVAASDPTSAWQRAGEGVFSPTLLARPEDEALGALRTGSPAPPPSLRPTAPSPSAHCLTPASGPTGSPATSPGAGAFRGAGRPEPSANSERRLRSDFTGGRKREPGARLPSGGGRSSGELATLLGGAAGLGMALAAGLRYACRRSCGKRTRVTLSERERHYGRGERATVHVQECGDLVRVRRIRENSLVLLAEYDVLAAPGD